MNAACAAALLRAEITHTPWTGARPGCSSPAFDQSHMQLYTFRAWMQYLCAPVLMWLKLRRYRLERDDGAGGDVDLLAYSGPETSAAVPGLRSGAQYRFRLWAFNEVRCGNRTSPAESQF